MPRLLHSLADNESNDSLASRMRRRRFARVQAVLDALPRPARVLDIGGTAGFWHSMGVAPSADLQIVLVNLEAQPTGDLPEWMTNHIGDARDLAEFADDSFELVFSNSVIEHVGTRADQARMAREVQRVGQRYCVQTPSRWFPIEPHFLVPGFQFLPAQVRATMVQRRALGWEPQVEDRAAALAHVRSIQLLDARAMRRMFPSARIERERLLGWTKSVTAVGGAD